MIEVELYVCGIFETLDDRARIPQCCETEDASYTFQTKSEYYMYKNAIVLLSLMTFIQNSFINIRPIALLCYIYISEK